MRGWLTTRKQVLTVGAGAALCLFATPAGVLAGTPTTVAPNAGATRIVAGGNNTTLDSCGYNPNGTPAFGENDIMEGAQVLTTASGSGTGTRVAAFGADERGILYPYSGSDANGRPENPSLFITDITSNPSSRSGDWQNGGAAHSTPNAVFGYTTDTVGVTATLKSAIPDSFNWTFAGGKLNAEAVWNASSLGLIAGHTYRFQLMVHDGDQNHTSQGGDVGEACVNLGIPAPPTPTFSLAKSVSPSASPVPVGTSLSYTITLKNTSTVSGDPGTVTDPITTTGGLTYHVTAGPTGSSGTASGPTAGVISWSPGTLAGGATETLTYTLVPDSTGGITDSAVNSNTNCPTPGVGVCTTHTDVVDFSLAKSVSPSGPVAVGTPLTYTVTLTNLSSTVAGDPGTINDTASGVDGATFALSLGPIVSQGLASGGPAAFTWTPGTLAGGGVATLKMVLTATSAGVGTSPAIDNTAFGTNTNCPTPGMAGCTTHNPLTSFGLSKAVSPTGTVTIGSTLTYTVTVTNLTTQSGDPGTISDNITTNGVSYSIVSGPTVSQGTTGGSDPNFTWSPGLLAGGAHATATIVLKVTGVTAGTVNPSITNTAFDINTNCPQPNNPTCTPSNPVTDFHMTKTVSPTGPVTVGSTLTYTITISNLTAVAGDPGTVADTITSNGVLYTVTSGPTPTQGSVSGSDPNFSWLTGSIPGGGSASATLVLKVTGVVAGTANPSIDNTAFDINTNCPTAGSTGCSPHTPVVQFTMSKTVSPTGTVTIGSTLTYTVTVNNTTSSAGDPGTVGDNITTNGVTYSIVSGPTPSQGTVSGNNPNFTWTPGSIAANSSATATLVLKVTGVVAGTANPSIENTAFDTNTNCPIPDSPNCTPNNPVTDFHMTKTVTPAGAVTVGSTLVYTVKVQNTTAVAGDPGTVADTITAHGVTYSITAGPTPSQGSASGSDPNFSWTPGQIGGNSSATLTLVLKVTGVVAGTSSPTIVNTAVDTNTNCATANNPDCTTNSPLIVLTLTKTVDKTSAALNDTLTYTITVGNTGAAAATNVLVDDIFGGDAGFLVNDGTNGTSNSFAGSPAITVTKLANGHYQWTYPTVNPGDTDTVTFTAVIQLPSTVLTNTSGTITLTNTVSIPSYNTGVNIPYNNPGNNPPPVTVSTVAPYNGGTQGCSTSNGCGTPNTGASLNVTLAGFLFLGGIGLILIGILARKPEETIS